MNRQASINPIKRVSLPVGKIQWDAKDPIVKIRFGLNLKIALDHIKSRSFTVLEYRTQWEES